MFTVTQIEAGITLQVSHACITEAWQMMTALSRRSIYITHTTEMIVMCKHRWYTAVDEHACWLSLGTYTI